MSQASDSVDIVTRGGSPGVTGSEAEVLAWAAGMLLFAFVWLVVVRLRISPAKEGEAYARARVLSPEGQVVYEVEYPGKGRVHNMCMWVTGKHEYSTGGTVGEAQLYITGYRADVRPGDWLIFCLRGAVSDAPITYVYYQVVKHNDVARPAGTRESPAYWHALIERVPTAYLNDYKL